MPTPRPAKRFPRRLGPGADLNAMAWFPSYRAPHPSELLDPDPFTPPGPPPLTAHGRQLLDAVLADPDADAPRLAVADWYDAQGDPRGEFIRIQVAQPGQYPDREWGLLHAHRSKWVAPFAPWAAEDVVFHRGFAEAMSLAGRAFISIGEALFQSTPLRDVRLVAVAPYLGELAASPHLARLDRLDLSGNRIGPQGLRTLSRSPHLGGLRRLDLSGNDLGPEGMVGLMEWPSRFESLALADNGLTTGDVRRLLAAPPCQALVELDLTRNRLGPGLAAVLGTAGFLDRATRLALGFTGATDADVRDLARSGVRPTDLDLRFNDLGDGGLQELAGTDWLDRCRSLSLRGNRLTRAVDLGGAFTRLDLSVNPLGDAGVAAWLGSDRPGLSDLRLANVLLTPAGLERLAAGGGLAGVGRLDLGGNNLGDAGVRVLAGCPDLTGLRDLDLTATDLGFAGAAALAGSPVLAGLRTLSLGLNPRLPAAGLQLLRQRFPEVKRLDH